MRGNGKLAASLLWVTLVFVVASPRGRCLARNSHQVAAATLPRAAMPRAAMQGATMQRARLQRARLQHATMQRARLQRATMRTLEPPPVCHGGASDILDECAAARRAGRLDRLDRLLRQAVGLASLTKLYARCELHCSLGRFDAKLAKRSCARFVAAAHRCARAPNSSQTRRALRELARYSGGTLTLQAGIRRVRDWQDALAERRAPIPPPIRDPRSARRQIRKRQKAMRANEQRLAKLVRSAKRLTKQLARLGDPRRRGGRANGAWIRRDLRRNREASQRLRASLATERRELARWLDWLASEGSADRPKRRAAVLTPRAAGVRAHDQAINASSRSATSRRPAAR